jgi:hypothetical protein
MQKFEWFQRSFNMELIFVAIDTSIRGLMVKIFFEK